jgi:hypothetical protein
MLLVPSDALGSLPGSDAPERLSLAVLSRDKWATLNFFLVTTFCTNLSFRRLPGRQVTIQRQERGSFDKGSATLGRHVLFLRALFPQVWQLTMACSSCQTCKAPASSSTLATSLLKLSNNSRRARNHAIKEILAPIGPNPFHHLS